MNKVRIWLAPLAAFALAAAADASVIYNGATNIAGNTATAQATFTIAGNVLQIELRNTSPLPGTGTYKPGDTLTGLSFKLPGATLMPSSATSPNALFLPVPCSVIGACGGANVDVGGEWGFSSHFPAVGSFGVAAAGYSSMPGNFGNGSPFPGGPNLDGPVAPGGVNFGIVSLLANAGNINGGLTEPLIRDTANFNLFGALGFLESSITDVYFWYGTDPEASSFGIPEDPGGCDTGGVCELSVPEPGPLFLIITGLLGLLTVRVGRRFRNAAV
ncbi:MAG: hypothetical protein KBA31_13355 [Alphaproteobacteria bacterium]|nr:hypothetical protein [Alphaproteobacteria bacterium]